MKCDICGEDVENSEDLQEHKEQAHPAGGDDKAKDNRERPDQLADAPDESAVS